MFKKENLSDKFDLNIRIKMPDIKGPVGFDKLGIADIILEAIKDLNYIEPTPVQKQVIPIALGGKDLIGIAQTGTGKTLAFGVPMVQRLAQHPNGCGLVVVPTRELAYQVEEAIRAISAAYKMRTVVIIGGVRIDTQRRALSQHPRIIIATPGRLLDQISHKMINISNIEILVIDEADRMLDMGFAPDINRIISYLPRARQTMLFSATMPGEIRALTHRYMNNPIAIEVSRSGDSPREIKHEVFFVDNRDKLKLFEGQLHSRLGSILVFARTKHGASKLARQIKTLGFSAAEIHSNRSLRQRLEALDGFKNGKYRVLVATDIAARGIDIDDISLVVNYDLPSTSEDYIHRIGRAGRAGKSGRAVSFATFNQEGEIRAIEELMGSRLPVSELPFTPSQGSMPRVRRSIIKSKPMASKHNAEPVPTSLSRPVLEKAFGRHRTKISGRSRRKR